MQEPQSAPRGAVSLLGGVLLYWLGGRDAAPCLGKIAGAGGLLKPENLLGCLFLILGCHLYFFCSPLTTSICLGNSNTDLELFSPLPASLLVLRLLEEKLLVDVKILAPLSCAIAFRGGQDFTHRICFSTSELCLFTKPSSELL